MTSLPSASNFNDPSTTEAQFQTSMANLLAYLAGLLGSTGTAVDARAALGLSSIVVNYNNRGNWVTATVYAVNDLVIQSSIVYCCQVAHTSGTFATDLSGGKWTIQQGVTAAQLAASNGGTMVCITAPGTGAILRNLSVKSAEFISITDYGADPTNVADCATAIANAQLATPYPYVPAGTYYVTNVRLDGLWGPGKIMYSSTGTPGTQELMIPRSARMASKIQSIIGKFGRIGWTAGSFGLVGDSISEGYWATDIKNTWFNKLNKMLNLGQSSPASGGEPEMTNFADPSRYGVSITGTTAIGANGPVQRSLIMQPGSVITFTGYFSYVDICYQRASGGGTLTMAYNGTTFKTVATAGTAANDVSSFPSATGAGASGTYTITCSGAAAEVTGLFRLVSLGRPGTFFNRFALTAQSTVMMSQDAVIASQMNHMNALNTGSKGVIFCAIMVNNANPTAGSTDPNVYRQALTKMFARYLAAGHYVIAIGGIFPSAAWTTVQPNYAGISAMQRRVCEQFGVPLIEMEQIEWQNNTSFGGALMYDGLHPNDAGNEAMLELITDYLASPNFNPAGSAQSNASNSYTPVFSWFTSGLPAASGTVVGKYWVNGNRCKVQINATSLTGLNSSSGPLCIGLPFTVNSSMRNSGTIGAVQGLTASGKQWTLQTVGGSNIAVIRTVDPTTGLYYDVTSLFSAGTFDAEIEYVFQD